MVLFETFWNPVLTSTPWGPASICHCTVKFIDPAMDPALVPWQSVEFFFAGDTMWFHDQAVRYTTGMPFWRLHYAAAWNEILPELEGTSTFGTAWRALCFQNQSTEPGLLAAFCLRIGSFSVTATADSVFKSGTTFSCSVSQLRTHSFPNHLFIFVWVFQQLQTMNPQALKAQ